MNHRSCGRMLVSLILLLSILLPMQASTGSVPEQQDDARRKALDLLSQLSPEERIGQLFLITFIGDQLDENSQILDLISNRHIGGVMLLTSNDNFRPGDDLVINTHQLISNLHRAEWEFSQGTNNLDNGTEMPHYVPLLIGISQEGDGYPNDQILSGLTPLPNLMSIGATWSPDLASQVGEVLGSELSALGVNLILGPSLDVLDRWSREGGSDLSTRTFGGDPYWVQKLGKAYIAGIHQGSDQRMAVIAKHFPGLGSSDRLPTYEVATVRKTMDQLKQIELVPFFSVTGNSTNPVETADGLLVSHIRYLFQGNIRATTRPVSLDPGAFMEMLNLPEIHDWHLGGGLMVSDDLGSQAVRQFYDPTGQNFTRQPILDAFLAGNDLLYLNNYVATNDADAYSTLTKTLDAFVRKYQEDPAFAVRVDDSVLRILTLKYRMYPDFDLDEIIPTEDTLPLIGNTEQQQGVSFEVARQAVTLISPSLAELPQPPDIRDRLVFITDTLSSRQCSQCVLEDELSVDALQEAVLRLYGPQAGGHVMQTRLSSYSFTDLISVLNYIPTPTGELSPLESDLNSATWIIFSMRNVDSERTASQALRRFLSERPALLRNKRLVVFAFNAPYYLDATDISKLTAYYALYSKIPAFLEVAARVLFQEITPIGASPVSIPGVGYNLIEITAPNPNQIIPLRLDQSGLEGEVGPEGTTTPEPIPSFEVGDLLPLEAGPLFDHNQNTVPDGTLVKFIFTVDGGATGSSILEAITQDGLARASYRIDRPGFVEIRAESDPAKSSGQIRLDVKNDASAVITVIAPTPFPTETPTPTATVTATPTLEPTPAPPPPAYPGVNDWLLAMLMVVAGGAIAYLGGVWSVSTRWGLRWGLSTISGGLLAYTYLAMGLPGGSTWIQTAGTGGILLITFLGVLLGLGAGLIWRTLLDQNFMHKV